MGVQVSHTEIRHVKQSRKDRRCDWCDEMIHVGDPYDTYRYFDSRDASTVRMHPECRLAMGDFAREEGGSCEWSPGSFSRGCTCERGRCECEATA